MAISSLTITALADMPLVRPGDDVAALLISAIERLGCGLRNDDVLVIAQEDRFEVRRTLRRSGCGFTE